MQSPLDCAWVVPEGAMSLGFLDDGEGVRERGERPPRGPRKTLLELWLFLFETGEALEVFEHHSLTYS